MIFKVKPFAEPKPAEPAETKAEKKNADSDDSDDDSVSNSDEDEESVNAQPGLSETVLAKINHLDDADSDE
jgi:hypothetical protein